MNEKRVIKKNVDSNGNILLIETSDVSFEDTFSNEGGLKPVGVTENIKSAAGSISELINSTSSSILSSGSLSGDKRPTKIGATFNVELSAEGSVWFIAKGEAKTGLTVTLEWDLT